MVSNIVKVGKGTLFKLASDSRIYLGFATPSGRQISETNKYNAGLDQSLAPAEEEITRGHYRPRPLIRT